MRLRSLTLELLEVLLEETDEQSLHLARSISQVRYCSRHSATNTCNLLLTCTQDVDLEILLSCLHWLWKLQQTYDLQNQYQLKKEARKALYKGYHNLRKMADYLNVPLKNLGKK